MVIIHDVDDRIFHPVQMMHTVEHDLVFVDNMDIESDEYVNVMYYNYSSSVFVFLLHLVEGYN